MRDFIISEIRRLAEANGGRPPGVRMFERETGIAEHAWRGTLWARWSEALVEAGLAANELQQAYGTDEVLNHVIKACCHYGRIPTVAELRLYKRKVKEFPNDKTVLRHFGGQTGLVAAVVKKMSESPFLADLISVPDAEPQAPTPRPFAGTPEGFVYLIKSGGHFKIGRSDNIEERVKSIRVALPEAASLVHTIRTDDPSGIEAYWHRRFADRRANGEWFKLTAQDVAAFKRRKYQ